MSGGARDRDAVLQYCAQDTDINVAKVARFHGLRTIGGKTYTTWCLVATGSLEGGRLLCLRLVLYRFLPTHSRFAAVVYAPVTARAAM